MIYGEWPQLSHRQVCSIWANTYNKNMFGGSKGKKKIFEIVNNTQHSSAHTFHSDSLTPNETFS